MQCDNCKSEMELETTVSDYPDPSNEYGHGQIEEEAWVCPHCGNTQEVEESEIL